jgi:hypothetical protein
MKIDLHVKSQSIGECERLTSEAQNTATQLATAMIAAGHITPTTMTIKKERGPETVVVTIAIGA